MDVVLEKMRNVTFARPHEGCYNSSAFGNLTETEIGKRRMSSSLYANIARIENFLLRPQDHFDITQYLIQTQGLVLRIG